MTAQVFDIITGVFATIQTGGKFDYRIFASGFIKKLTMLVAVSFGYFIDTYNILGEAVNINIEMAIASAFITVEVLSNLSNFKKMGLQIPIIEKYIKLD
jgi:toxin secretion/phage lysis holin